MPNDDTINELREDAVRRLANVVKHAHHHAHADDTAARFLHALEAGRIADALENLATLLKTGLSKGSPLVEALRIRPRTYQPGERRCPQCRGTGSVRCPKE